MTKGLFKKNINRSIGGNLLVFLIVLLLACFMLLPIVYAVSSAFKPLDEIFIFPPRMFVRKPTLDNFVQLAQITSSSWVPLSRYIFNSLFVSAVGTVGHMLMASMAAYPLAKHRFIGQRTISGVVKLSLLFTSAVTAIPQYIVMSSIGIVNTYWALIFPAFQAALGLYLMQSFMGQIPEEMLEAARIDGAGELRIFWRIVMPNVKPAWLTVIIFSFQQVWNNVGSCVIYDEKIKLLGSLLTQVTAAGTARAGAGAALGLILMIPPILLFVLSQRRVIETMSTSGMK